MCSAPKRHKSIICKFCLKDCSHTRKNNVIQHNFQLKGYKNTKAFHDKSAWIEQPRYGHVVFIIKKLNPLFQVSLIRVGPLSAF